MTSYMEMMAIAGSGMNAQAARLRISAENIANVDTPGYQRKHIPFRAYVEDGVTQVRTGRMYLDKSEGTAIYDPAHPLAGADGTYEGSNVKTMLEIADAREAQRSYEANLRMFDQVRQMTDSLITLLRR